MGHQSTTSIIIPVYNVAPYLTRCIESCIYQTYKELEILIINDGSTDNSLEIIKSYASKDNRIKIIDKTNGGLNSAREAGIAACSGTNVTILDGDDYLEHDAIEKLVNSIEEEKADIVVGGAKIVLAENNQQIDTLQHPNLVLYNEDYTKRTLTSGPNTVCMKLYKSKLVKKQTEYPNIKAGQDFPVTIQWGLRAKKVVFTSELIYNYVVARKGSTMSGDRKIYVEAGFQAYYYSFNLLVNNPYLHKFQKELTQWTCNKLYNYLYHPSNKFYRNKHKIAEMRRFAFKNRVFFTNMQYHIFIRLLMLNIYVAHIFVALMQKMKPTLYPHTK
jgi:glycosyltransferase involved in cell wall biosynthesis